MSWWEKVRAALGREAAEARESYRDAEARVDAELTRREADLAATPEEKLARTMEQLNVDPDPLDEVRTRIERMGDGPGAEPDGADPADERRGGGPTC